jgi:hypothetical protein
MTAIVAAARAEEIVWTGKQEPERPEGRCHR